jgi:predicted phage terminase large subunit-like protein
MEWWGGRAKWNGQDYRWTFQTRDAVRPATVSFGYMRYPEDHFRYQSSAFQYIGFDEVNQFEEYQYRYMFSRLRRLEGSKIPLRVRCASNPGGVGHEWVKRRFIDPGSPERPFIPSRLDDNPYLDRDTYRLSLSELDPTTREQLLNGDWNVKPPGGMFKRGWFTIVKEAPTEGKAIRYWDLAASVPAPGRDAAYTAGALVVLKNGIYFIVDIQRFQGSPLDVERRIIQTAALDKGRPYNVEIWMEQEPGSSGVNTVDHYAREILLGYTFRGDKVTGAKELRAQPVSSAAEAGNVKLVIGSWVNNFLDEAEVFPEGKHKDQIDSVSGAISKLARTPEPAFIFG